MTWRSAYALSLPAQLVLRRASMRHPVQRLVARSAQGKEQAVLVTAAGHKLFSYGLKSGHLLSIWPETDPASSNNAQDVTSGAGSITSGVESSEPPNDPPRKRRRLSDPVTEGADAPGKESDKPRGKPKGAGLNSGPPAIIKLGITSSGKYIIAVTGEDKCIRMFELDEDGKLSLLSERSMLKRPCAIETTFDESYIVCADKFGDVYSLPLLEETRTEAQGVVPHDEHGSHSTTKTFVPSANERTVHTVRNQQALKNQLRSANLAAEKKALDFEHRLLLGHVSMLTDVALTRPIDGQSDGPARGPFIITSDRDEHIRVSRGQPQAHVIHGYCLGHTEFVSRLEIPEWQPHTLISGGGDGHLFVWDWYNGSLLQKVDLQRTVQTFTQAASSNMVSNGKPTQYGTASETTTTLATSPTSNGHLVGAGHVQPYEEATNAAFNVAVSGIWVVAMEGSGRDGTRKEGKVLVACEGVPAIFSYHLSAEAELEHHQTLPLKGNALDVAICELDRSIVVSIDNIHRPASDEDRNVEVVDDMPLLQTFTLCPEAGQISWVEDMRYGDAVRKINNKGSFEMEPAMARGIKDLLYNIETLRKRGMEE